MKTYKAIFTCNSNISKLPDAQTIFGAICNIIKYTQGENKLIEYLESFNNTPHFIHSSMFVNGFLPMVKESLFSIDLVNRLVLETENKRQLEVLQKLKEFKKINYISENVFRDYIDDNLMNLRNELLQEKPKLKIVNNCLVYDDEQAIKSIKELLTHVKTDKMDVENGQDRDLFYDMNFCYAKDTEFCVFIKSNLSSDTLEQLLKYFEFFGVGNRVSVGKNLFSFIRLEEIQISNKTTTKKMAISKFIPNGHEINIEESYYQIASSIHRTSFDYLKNCISGKFVQLIEGSFVELTRDCEYIGKVIKTEVNDKTVYHYAIGFMV